MGRRAKLYNRSQPPLRSQCLIVRWATDDPNPKAKKELKEELEAKFIKKMLEDPERQRQILLETQTDHDLNAYYQQGNTSASSAPWAAAIGAPPPPPPPKKKGKKKAVSATTVDSGAGKTASPGAPVSSALLNKDSLAMLGSAVKAAPAPGNPATAPVPTALGLVAAYDSD